MNQKGLAPIIIVLLIALGIGGYLLYQKQKPVLVSQLSPSPIASVFTLSEGCAFTYRDLQEALKNPLQVCYLDLSRQNLTELPEEILRFINLRSLYLNFNKITTLPEEIRNLKNLTLIDLTGNPITNNEVEKIRKLLPDADIVVIKPMNLPR